MKKRNISIILGTFFLSAGAFFALALTWPHEKIESPNELINISELSEEFMDNYFQEISKHNSKEEKENMLIAIASNGIKDSYGAINIIESPNHQYILQYDSKEQKENALAELIKDKNIKSVEENNIYTIETTSYNSWGIEKMSLDHAINSTDPDAENVEEITAAIIDTGCDMALFNKYYGGKISEFYNVLESSTTIMADENGHGTHIAGTIAEGTPSNVKILPIKVSTDGTMYSTDIVDAINYITYNNKAQVINMSFGSYYKNDSIAQAIESANKKNIISVAAAGNDNTSKDHYPSALENTISIASVDSNLNKSTFSNYGARITFTAPGTDIKSIMGKEATISKKHGNNDDDDHEIISGTSMATPHAVAAVAILKSYNKNLTFENVVNILKDNAQDLGEEGWDEYYGNGLISFKNVEFCDGTYCDELGVYKDSTKSISSIETINLNLTQYNYYSSMNLMGSTVVVNYTDNTSEEIAISKLPNVEITGYDPTSTHNQAVTIKINNLETTIQVTNPDNYESGWEYNTLPNGHIEITGYKNHNLGIKKLYVPEMIDSKWVASFADNFKFAESGNDIESYTHLYLPSAFTRIGDYSLSNTKIKYIYGDSAGMEIGSHGLESSKIEIIDIVITKVESYGFKDCFNLKSIDVSGTFSYISASNTKIGTVIIEEYAFYNCKELSIVRHSEYDTVFIETLGSHAFDNCVSLSNFELEASGNIEEYAFYNTFMLADINLYYSDEIGQYAFYGSGITEANVGRINTIQPSSFENCKNLKSVKITSGKIESRAFWNSGIESISIGDSVEYIAEDAFAYTPMKKSNSDNHGTGNYKSEYGLGIVETSTNKLIIGFTNNIGASNTRIPDYITEIGNYAFTGNNNLKRITIPANITKIGAHAFEDCYQLSDVYMLGDTIDFDDNTFRRTYEGELQNADFTIYVYRDSDTKQIVKNKNLSYKHIDPDEVIVTNYETTYEALSQVDWQTLKVKLIYHEDGGDREEILDPYASSSTAPISDHIGFFTLYPTEGNYYFQYGDSYFIVEARNALGHLSTKRIDVTVIKKKPTYEIPTGLTANFGQQLSDIELPSGFEWTDGNQIITESGEVTYKARFVPTDTNNYETIENIDITITVSDSKTIVTPEITVSNKTYDGTADIPISNITVSNLESSEYSIVSATSSSANVGERDATVTLRLSNEKFEEYAFSNGQQEKDFVIKFNIEKANLAITDNSSDKIVVFDENPHTINMDLEYPPNTQIKYKDTNGEYTLNQIPEYTEVGEYVIGYKLYIDENYTEYFSEHTLTILSNFLVKFDDGIAIQNDTLIIKPEDTFSAITNKIHTTPIDNSFEHRNKDNNVVDSETIKTGDKLKIIVDGHEQEYNIVVLGDTDGDGAITEADYLSIKKDIMDTEKLSGIYKKAADMNENNEIDIIDYIRIKKIVMGGNL